MANSRLLWQGRRTALPRHRRSAPHSSGATICSQNSSGSSYGRLAVFVGTFSLEAAQAVAADTSTTAAGRGTVANLAAKSTVTTEIGATGVRIAY